jgi:hypothetical protein
VAASVIVKARHSVTVWRLAMDFISAVVCTFGCGLRIRQRFEITVKEKLERAYGSNVERLKITRTTDIWANIIDGKTTAYSKANTRSLTASFYHVKYAPYLYLFANNPFPLLTISAFLYTTWSPTPLTTISIITAANSSPRIAHCDLNAKGKTALAQPPFASTAPGLTTQVTQRSLCSGS